MVWTKTQNAKPMITGVGESIFQTEKKDNNTIQNGRGQDLWAKNWEISGRHLNWNLELGWGLFQVVFSERNYERDKMKIIDSKKYFGNH